MHSAEMVVPITRNYLYYYTSKIFVFHQKEIENHRIFNRRDIKKTYFSRGVPSPPLMVRRTYWTFRGKLISHQPALRRDKKSKISHSLAFHQVEVPTLLFLEDIITSEITNKIPTTCTTTG